MPYVLFEEQVSLYLQDFPLLIPNIRCCQHFVPSLPAAPLPQLAGVEIELVFGRWWKNRSSQSPSNLLGIIVVGEIVHNPVLT
jgi:hypothetical protein